MSGILELAKSLVDSVNFFLKEKLVGDIIEGKELEKQIEDDLKNVDRILKK